MVVGTCSDRCFGLGSTVFGGVLQCFGTAVVKRGFDLRGVRPRLCTLTSTGRAACAACRWQGLLQAAADQQRWINAVGESVDLGNRGLNQLSGFGE